MQIAPLAFFLLGPSSRDRPRRNRRAQLLRQAKPDSDPGITCDPEDLPEVANLVLLTVTAAISGRVLRDGSAAARGIAQSTLTQLAAATRMNYLIRRRIRRRGQSTPASG